MTMNLAMRKGKARGSTRGKRKKENEATKREQLGITYIYIVCCIRRVRGGGGGSNLAILIPCGRAVINAKHTFEICLALISLAGSASPEIN